MTPKQYQNLARQARAYYDGLTVADVVKEFTSGPILISNTKLQKGDRVNLGFEATPATLATLEFNSCEAATSCKLTCLVFATMTAMFESKTGKLCNTLKKRIRRLFLLLNATDFCIQKINLEIESAALAGPVAVRLNVFTDIEWTRYGINFNAPGVTWYDYTKVKARAGRSDYPIDITYSASERDRVEDLLEVLRHSRVAMVFPGKTLPEEWNGFPVIDGDETDNRYLEPKGVVVGLRQKATQHGKTENKFVKAFA